MKICLIITAVIIGIGVIDLEIKMLKEMRKKYLEYYAETSEVK